MCEGNAMKRNYKTILLSSFVIFSSVFCQDPDILSTIDKKLINTVKILRGERSLLKSKAIALGAALGTVTGLAAASPYIADPQTEIQLYREPRVDEESDTLTRENLLDLGEKIAVAGIPSAIAGAGVGALYSKFKKQRTLSRLNALLQAYSSYPSFKDLSLPQSALIYAAYLQDFEQLAPIAKAMPDFLNEKGIFNIITTLYFNQHATHDLMDNLKKRLELPQLQFNYLPDVLAKPSLWQNMKEMGTSGVAKVKTGMGAIGSGMSKIKQATVGSFGLNYVSEKELDPYLSDSATFDAFLQNYNPNILVGTFGGYITGYNATPVLGYAMWHGKDNFAEFLIDNGAHLEDSRIKSRTLYDKKNYTNYLDLAIDRQRLPLVKKLLTLEFKIGNEELKRAFASPEPSIQSYFK